MKHESEIALSPTIESARGSPLPTLLVSVSGQWFLQYFSVVEADDESLLQALLEEETLKPGDSLDDYLTSIANENGDMASSSANIPSPAKATVPRKATPATPATPSNPKPSKNAPASDPAKKRKREDDDSAFRPRKSKVSESAASEKRASSSSSSSGSRKVTLPSTSVVTKDSDAPVADSGDPRLRRRLQDPRFASMFRAYLMRFGSGSPVPKQNQAVFWQVYPDADPVTRKICETAAVPFYNDLIQHQSTTSAMRIENLRLSQKDISVILRIPNLINQALFVSTDAIAHVLLSSPLIADFRAAQVSPLSWWTPCADLIMLTWIRDWGLPNEWATECQKSTFLYMMAGTERRREACLSKNAPLREVKPSPKVVIDKDWQQFSHQLVEWMTDTSEMLARMESLVDALTPCFPPDQQRVISDLKKRPFNAAQSSSELIDAMARFALLRFGMEYVSKVDAEVDNPVWRIYYDPSRSVREDFVHQIAEIIQAALPDIQRVRDQRSSSCRLGGSMTLNYEDVVRIDTVTATLRRLKTMTDHVASVIVAGAEYRAWSSQIQVASTVDPWWGPDAEMIALCYFRDCGLPLRLEEELNTGTLLYEMGALMDEEERATGGRTMSEKIGLSRAPIGRLTRQVADELWERWLPDLKSWCRDEATLVRRAYEFAVRLDVFFVKAVASKPEYQDKLPGGTLKKMLLRFGTHPTKDDHNLMVEKFSALRPSGKADPEHLQTLVSLLVAGCKVVAERLKDADASNASANCGAFELTAAEVTGILRLSDARERLSKYMNKLPGFMSTPFYEEWANSWRPADLPWFSGEVELCIARIAVKHGLPLDWANELARLRFHLSRAETNDPSPLGDFPFYKDMRIAPLNQVTKDMTIAVDNFRDKSILRMIELADLLDLNSAKSKKARSDAQSKARKDQNERKKPQAKQTSRSALSFSSASLPGSRTTHSSLPVAAPVRVSPTNVRTSSEVPVAYSGVPENGSPLIYQHHVQEEAGTIADAAADDYDGTDIPAAKRHKYDEAPDFLLYPRRASPPPPMDAHVRELPSALSPDDQFNEPSSAPVEDGLLHAGVDDSMNVDDVSGHVDFTLGEAAAVSDV